MSCLFHSISHFLTENSNTIREQICDYLQNNGDIMDGINTKTVLQFEEPNYINQMRKTSTQGGAIEIQCACNIWKLRILVENIRHGVNEKIEFLPICGNHEKTIALKWDGGHYIPATC